MDGYRRRAIYYLPPFLAGTAMAAVWLHAIGAGNLLSGLNRVDWGWTTGMLMLTAVSMLTRFVRWQFLLRRVDLRVAIRPSLATYLAAVPGIATPAYVGEILRSAFLKRRFGMPLRTTGTVLIAERVYDAVALSLIAIATAADTAGMKVGAAFLVLSVSVAFVLWPIGRHAFISKRDLARFRAPSTVIPALGLSIAAWGAAAGLVSLGAGAFGVSLPILSGAYIFTSSTLIGALTLLPAGIGAVGSSIAFQLTAAGLPTATAVLIVSLVRLTSTGAALVVGTAFLMRELRLPRGTVRKGAMHFDDIAAEYSAQFSDHVWDHLLRRKVDLMAASLPPPERAGLGLDLGCGLGRQMVEMSRRGYRVIGLEHSLGLLAAGQAKNQNHLVINGDARSLPFGDASVDFVYAVGVLHHLGGAAEQAAAYREVQRVLKPGGTMFVHESNPRNPVFRFYMGYVFPLLKEIDEGTEWWIEPHQPSAPEGLRLESVRYFTFLPDFTPRRFMAPALRVQEWLERSAFAPYAAHYLAVLRRTDRA